MRTLSDLQKRILESEFPGMSFESDPDIERYFELRKMGRQGDALSIYNTKLRRKFPNDEQRTALLRYFRSNDPRYREMLRETTIALADRAIARTTGILELLTRDIETIDMTDAYSVIKLAEGLLAVISPDRYAAIAFTEKYVRYAKILQYRHSSMEKTAELIRLYVTDTIDSVQELKKQHEERRKKRAKEMVDRSRARKNFDLSRIEFNAADVAKILIPPEISKTEDRVIAYCIKYWNLVGDATFEKTIFLYSRKFRTQHSDIFQAIKNGRTHGWKDEEILNAVLANIVTGYYYNISGDLYLQRTWERYKQTIGTPANGSASAVASVATQSSFKVRDKQSSPVSLKKGSTPKNEDKRISSPKRRGDGATKRITPFKPTLKGGMRRGAQTASLQPAKSARIKEPSFTPNSIADIIRKMTGKSYTVYKELFFKGIRPSIRATLAASSGKRGNLFGSKQNAAEELVFGFLSAHYSDPYQNWERSVERSEAHALGYDIPAIEPIIENWVQHNG